MAGETPVFGNSIDIEAPVRRTAGELMAVDGVEVIPVPPTATEDRERAGDKAGGDKDSARECADAGDIEDGADGLLLLLVAINPCTLPDPRQPVSPMRGIFSGTLGTCKCKEEMVIKFSYN